MTWIQGMSGGSTLCAWQLTTSSAETTILSLRLFRCVSHRSWKFGLHGFISAVDENPIDWLSPRTIEEVKGSELSLALINSCQLPWGCTSLSPSKLFATEGFSWEHGEGSMHGVCCAFRCYFWGSRLVLLSLLELHEPLCNFKMMMESGKWISQMFLWSVIQALVSSHWFLTLRVSFPGRGRNLRVQ